MRHRICHLLDNDTNLDTSYFWSIVRQHDRERFPVIFCTSSAAGSLQHRLGAEGTPQFSLEAASRWQYPMAILRLARLLRRQEVSILHAHFFDPTCIGLIAARMAGVRFVFTRHHSDHNSRIGKKWHTRIDAWCARLADQVIAVSEATRRLMIENEGVPGHKITTVYNGMNALEPVSPEAALKVRRELRLGEEPVLLMLARLHEEKGHRYLFDAIPEVLSRVGPITVLLGGEGSYRPVLEAEVRSRGLDKVVRFLGRRADVAKLIALSSLLVLPSLAESFGFVLLEAMSSGKPVVATTAGGIPEVVSDGETGLLVPVADSHALADAVCRILQEPELAHSLGENGRRRAAFFNFEKMILGYEAVYDRLFGGATEASRGAPKAQLVITKPVSGEDNSI